MFDTISRSWYFAKVSYGTIWAHKRLLVFPILSALASLLVLASFAGGVLGSGLVQWVDTVDGTELQLANEVAGYVVGFLFYFCSYFVIVFFNAALTACALETVQGRTPSVGGGLSAAAGRLPQIAGWALVSALVGLVLRAIENAHQKAGELVAALLGTAWTALTFFVVPALVVEGVGPLEAIKSSGRTLRKTWGEALVGNVSLGLIGFLCFLPVLLLLGVAGFFAASSQSVGVLIGVGAAAAALVLAFCAFTSAADVVFKALLYTHATSRGVVGVDQRRLQEAFRRK